MNSQEINTTELFLLNDGGIVRSVSVILYSEEFGYLLCDEVRKGFPETSTKSLYNHMIGGKVDLDDTSPLYSGLREMVEELDFYLDGKNKNEMVEYLCNYLFTCKSIEYDLCVSVKKKLYNRFYVINIDKIQDKQELLKILNFLLNWEKKEESTLEKVYFWNGKDSLPLMTTLLKFFVENLSNSNLLK